ncbi:hypothetical protein A7K73_06840 [Candidatus Methylacidiphilum fumarolicum]|nr:hypothetical protein A7K73_06840 [Candidatus Methylacidiphilum fumarolicum]TFE74164.1 hypothetical protein A7D33_02180 [Candidatus Methylacidiphilum fumarolicum]
MLPLSRILEGGDHAGERQSTKGSLLLYMQVAGRALSREKRVGNASSAPSPAKARWGISPGNGRQSEVASLFLYRYLWTKIALEKGDAGTGAAYAAALSLPGLNAGVSREIG